MNVFYKNIYFIFIGFLLLIQQGNAGVPSKLKFIEADNEYIQYTGRIDFTNPKKPKFWAPGVYIKAKFKGSTCEIVINDEELYGNTHNYLEIAIDNLTPFKIQTTGKTNTIKVADKLGKGAHTITICKNTESGIGYLEFLGFKCEGLMALPPKPKRKLEFVGNSITCGTGSDISKVPCGKGQWYDQHNTYLSYGPTVARQLNAQWQLTSASGIGLIHSCCNMPVTMPQVFDKVNLSKDTIAWDFNKYIPDAITVCLGQNDGIQDSTTFCTAYVKFIGTIRSKYPAAQIVLLTSPMADTILTPVLKKYITGVLNNLNNGGDKKVHKFFFSRSFNSGCGGHPDLGEHKLIAKELAGYLESVLE